ncbi:MAG TPA: hypothetical protein VFW00_07080 [Rhodocyclaceae bacterium]|nr:hypothetical protein [Rhodocyclaceae bacterium]
MPSLPFELAHIWEWFTKLSGKRQNGMAVNPISSSEILAWQQRQRIRFDPFEESVIDRLDATFLKHQNKPAAKT